MLERSNPLLAMTTAISECRTAQKAVLSRLRREITACTNIVEGHNHFLQLVAGFPA